MNISICFAMIEKIATVIIARRALRKGKYRHLFKRWRFKEWYDQYKYDVGARWQETNRLFISEDGKVMYPGTISYWVHKICDQAGLPNRTVHSLRHTNITMQIAAGVPLVTDAGRVGHARTSTTTDIYSHFLKTTDRSAAQKLEEIFD